MDYPQAFVDGKRALAGTNIIECPDSLSSEACGPDQVRITPLHWIITTDGAGPGGNMRELRLHPDNVHIGFNALSITSNGLAQYPFFGRLSYDPSPATGEPLVPRYNIVNASLLYSKQDSAPIIVDPEDPSQLILRPDSLAIGELRGFGGTGKGAHLSRSSG